MKTPNVNLTLGFGATVAASVVAGLVLLWFQNKNAFNPVSGKNLANQGFEAVVKATTGSDDPGGDFYSWTHNPDGSLKPWSSPLWFLDRLGDLPDKGVSW